MRVILHPTWILDGCDPIFPYISDLDLQPTAGFIFTIGYSICGVLLSINGFQISAIRGLWMERKNLENKWVIISGKVNFFKNKYQITNPDYVSNIDNKEYVIKKLTGMNSNRRHTRKLVISRIC